MRKEVMQEVAQLSQFDEELYKVGSGVVSDHALVMLYCLFSQGGSVYCTFTVLESWALV